jgi:hypothetical protein
MRTAFTSLNVKRMREKRHVGRAAIPRRDVPPSPLKNKSARNAGRARIGQAVGKSPPVERAKTNVIKPPTEDRPVFVDPSGMRRRRLRRLAYLIGAILVLALVLVWVSQVSGLL